MQMGVSVRRARFRRSYIMPEGAGALATSVQAQTVELMDASETLTLTGEIRAQFESDLAFRVGGRITERHVDVGDHVVADKVLAKIDPNEQQSNLTAAESIGPRSDRLETPRANTKRAYLKNRLNFFTL
jgi:multidrug efflux pump subunit AcrA (membrane-fusion protein)